MAHNSEVSLLPLCEVKNHISRANYFLRIYLLSLNALFKLLGLLDEEEEEKMLSNALQIKISLN